MRLQKLKESKKGVILNSILLSGRMADLLLKMNFTRVRMFELRTLKVKILYKSNRLS